MTVSSSGKGVRAGQLSERRLKIGLTNTREAGKRDKKRANSSKSR
jgi:hypothetical protein